jgi:peptidoglycan/xylan/chitin deacetylase (PgdA/CDA1 family)
VTPVVWIAIAAKSAAVVLWCFSPWLTLAAALFFGAGGLVVYHLLAPSATGVCHVCTRFRTARKDVWLTIDDGPDPDDTPRILDLLEAHGARATFFVIGERAARYPELVTEIVRRGHEVALHTHTHPLGTFWCAGPARVRRELDPPLRFFHALGIRPRFFRPPVGIKNLFLARELGARAVTCVAWTIRSGDCWGRDPDKIAARVLRRIQPGAIVLLHEGPSVPRAVRVHAIARVLEGLRAQGFACVVPSRAQL